MAGLLKIIIQRFLESAMIESTHRPAVQKKPKKPKRPGWRRKSTDGLPRFGNVSD